MVETGIPLYLSSGRVSGIVAREPGATLCLTPGLPQSMLSPMSAQEIIAELPKLKPEELRLVKAKVDDLARAERRTIGKVLLEFAGTAEGLPRDMARNHDHYLNGTPRQES
jgi:hypothetical protein